VALIHAHFSNQCADNLIISFVFVNSTLHLLPHFVMLTLQICNKKNSWQYFWKIFFVELLVYFMTKIGLHQNH